MPEPKFIFEFIDKWHKPSYSFDQQASSKINDVKIDQSLIELLTRITKAYLTKRWQYLKKHKSENLMHVSPTKS